MVKAVNIASYVANAVLLIALIGVTIFLYGTNSELSACQKQLKTTPSPSPAPSSVTEQSVSSTTPIETKSPEPSSTTEQSVSSTTPIETKSTEPSSTTEQSVSSTTPIETKSTESLDPKKPAPSPEIPKSLGTYDLTESKYNETCFATLTDAQYQSVGPEFKISDDKKCIIQKDFLSQGIKKMNVTTKKTATNNEENSMITLNVKAREKSLFTKNQLNVLLIDSKFINVSLTPEHMKTYKNYQIISPLKKEFTIKQEESKVKFNSTKTFTGEELKKPISITFEADNGAGLKEKEEIKICAIETPLTIKTTSFTYSKKSAGEMTVSVNTPTIDGCDFTTEFNKVDETDKTFEVSKNGKVTLVKPEDLPVGKKTIKVAFKTTDIEISKPIDIEINVTA